MTAQPEIRENRLLRILSDLFSIVALGAGGFGMMAVLLVSRGWEARGDLDGARALLVDFATAVIWAFGPIVTGIVSFLMIAIGILALFSGRRPSLLWLSLTLACGAVLLQPTQCEWLDFSIVLALAAGWCLQIAKCKKAENNSEACAQ